MICVELERTLQDTGSWVDSAHTLQSAVPSIQKKQCDAVLPEFNLNSLRKYHH